ncbi:aminoglycoside 3'-phosphotransferase [Agromyces aureus]|uniref:Aminoglycoside phosphotransferase n=1 Tax=Agromyces aureus TaxID=453304 RepID=A0A191WET0_9MICO|nr:aminoglycoside 3'-phosphotransferase [Agromyces aureus]ANJ26766.1 aminoglycoside phosphotransferase [Agromyces aureus]
MTRELAGVPDVEPRVPPAVTAFADGAPITPVWRNGVGGLTFRVDRPASAGGSCFIKWNPSGSGESLADEERRLAWLRDRFAVPRVVAAGRDDSGEWLATAAIDAASAVAPIWKQRADAAARAMGTGLRRLHDGIDPAECPFDWSVARRIAVAEASGIIVPDDLRDPPSVDRMVVCHGDPCAPNTLIDAHGGFAGIVDVARLGVADRWADLAVGSWSLEWNFGDGHEPAFFEAYGVAPDPDRIAYYRALWDAT